MSDERFSKNGPRFSLLNLLLLMTVAALGVGLYRSKQRNDQLAVSNELLKAENLKHRNELGIFDIVDPAKVHVIRVPARGQDGLHAYRLYLPPGRQYRLGYRANRVPEEDLPELADYLPMHGGEYSMKPGGYLIRIRKASSRYEVAGGFRGSANIDLDIDPTDGQRFSSTNAGIGFSQEKNRWLDPDGNGMSFKISEVGRELETHDPEEPLVLYRTRVMEKFPIEGDADGGPTRWRGREPQGPCDGFMTWIESKKEAVDD